VRWTRAALALTVSTAASAVITVPVAAAAPPTLLTLTVRAAGKPAVRASLGCAPARGTHPAARQACAALAGVHGHIGALPADPSVCFTLYEPVVASASGTWRGRKVRYRQTYSNDCELRRQTGVVFAIQSV
jgi:hypothetical protein